MRFHTAVLAATFALSATPLGQAQLLPFGEFAARDGRPGLGKTWRINDAQGQKLAAALNAIAAKTPIVIDYEHHTLTAQANGHLAVASGWIQRTEWRDGQGLFATVDWTAAAKARIESKEYQYISPVILYDDAGNVTGLALAALVNYPAIVGMDAAMATALSTLSASLQHHTLEPTVTLLAALIAGLGLKADATEPDVIASVAALKAQVAAPPVLPTALSTALKLGDGADAAAALSAVQALSAGQASAHQTIAALNAEIVTLKSKAGSDQVAGLVDTALADGRLSPAAKAYALDLGRSNLAALQGMLDATPKATYTASQSGGTPPADKVAALSAEQSQVFAAFGIAQDAALKHLQTQQGKPA